MTNNVIYAGYAATRTPSGLDQTTAAEHARRASISRNIISGYAVDQLGVRAAFATIGVPLNAPQDVIDQLPASVKARARAAQKLRDELCAMLDIQAPPKPQPPTPPAKPNTSRTRTPRRRFINTETAEDNWRLRAACSGEDPELFFPIGSSGPALKQTELAKAICRHCPVSEQCRKWSLEAGVEFGIWGGVDEDERNRKRRDRNILQATTLPTI